MTGVFCSKPFALKHMSQMTAAMCADDFHPSTICIGKTPDRPVDLIIKTGPAAVRGEFIL